MKEISQNKQLASAVKRATLGAAATAMLTSAGIASADHGHEHALLHDVEIKVHGYVKTDAIYDLDSDLGPSFAVSRIPTGSGTDSETSFRIHSLQSRLNFSAAKDDMKVVIEADFFTDAGNEAVSNSRHERLRHAYFEVGDLLVGQTWSTFMDANWVLYPVTIDFAGPAAATFIRQSQFRYTIMDGLDFALENPEGRVRSDGDSRDSLPDVILRYASAGDISWQVAGLFQQFEVDGGTADGESESNLGVTGGVNFKFGKGNSVSVKANVNSNRYTYYGWLNPSAVTDGGDIELIDHTAVVAALNLDWGGDSNAQTTIAVGAVQFDDDHLDGDDVDNVTTVHANYRWSPYQNIDFGVEAMYGEQELVNGDDGDATRLQFGAKYNF